MEADGAAQLSPESGPGQAVWLLTSAWTAMGRMLWVLFPMTATVLLPLCCVARWLGFGQARGRLPSYPLPPTTVALIVTAGYLLINAS